MRLTYGHRADLLIVPPLCLAESTTGLFYRKLKSGHLCPPGELVSRLAPCASSRKEKLK